jgi:hypothetical protein
MNKILLTSNPIVLTQTEFGGFKPILTDSHLLWGLLNIQKGGGVNNFIVQVLFDENSKIILNKYLTQGSFEGQLIMVDNPEIIPGKITHQQLKAIIVMILLLIILVAIAFMILYRRKGYVSAVDLIIGVLFNGFIIRFFDLIFDIRLIIFFILGVLSMICLSFWRHYKINQQNIMVENDDNFMMRKQLYKYFNKMITGIGLGLGFLMLILYFLIGEWRQGILSILITIITILINHNLLWRNWILFYSVEND